MSKIKYTPELRAQIIKDLESTNDVKLVAKKHSVPEHAVYRIKRENLRAPEIAKEKKIKQLTKELADKDLENQILRELLKKTYQVMPID